MTLTLSTVYTGKCWRPATAPAVQLPASVLLGHQSAVTVNPRAGDERMLASL